MAYCMKEVHQKDAVTLSIQLEGIPGKMHEQQIREDSRFFSSRCKRAGRLGLLMAAPVLKKEYWISLLSEGVVEA